MYPPLKNPLKWFDNDTLSTSKTLETGKVLVPSVKSHLIPVC